MSQSAEIDAVSPWRGQRVGTAACLHFGAVQVDSSVTGEPLSRWCPTCEGTQYAQPEEWHVGTYVDSDSLFRHPGTLADCAECCVIPPGLSQEGE